MQIMVLSKKCASRNQLKYKIVLLISLVGLFWGQHNGSEILKIITQPMNGTQNSRHFNIQHAPCQRGSLSS
jgi:hypothetical protein